METKQLILTAKELNNLFGLTPPIDLKLPSKELQEMVAVQAAPLLNAKGEDELTEDTAEVLKELIPLYMDQYNKETLRIFKLYELIEDKKVVKETKEEKQPDQEEVKSGKDELVEEVEMADRLADLKSIAKEYDEFKGIRGVLTKYNSVNGLREMMLDFLSRAEGNTEDGRNEKEGKKPELSEKKTIMKISEIKTQKPFNSIFDIDDNMLNTIKEHIEKNGYDPAFPIVLWNNIVIDGNTRLKAAELVGIEVIPVEQKDFASEQEALEYAIHNQRDRRNLTQSELLRCIEVLDKRMQTGRHKKNVFESKNISEPSHHQTAKTLGIGKSKVSDARIILDDKKARHQVETGKKSISAAAKEIRAKKKPQKQIEKPEKTRIESIVQVLKDHSDAKMQIFDIVREANQIYKDFGGESDIKESGKITDIVILVLVAIDWIKKLSPDEIQISEL